MKDHSEEYRKIKEALPLERLCRKSFSSSRGSGVSAAESAGINQ